MTPWVGLRKINVSYWCWEDMSPFTNTSLQWLPGEPSDAGFCGYLAEPASSGLKAQTCINPVNGSLCERPGGFTPRQTLSVQGAVRRGRSASAQAASLSSSVYMRIFVPPNYREQVQVTWAESSMMSSHKDDKQALLFITS